MKTYAHGFRVGEVPLPEPVHAAIVEAPCPEDHPEECVVVGKIRRPRRKAFRQLPCSVPSFAPICADSNDPATVESGFSKRVLRQDLPTPVAARLQALKRFVAGWLDAHLPQVEPMAFEEWLASTSYNEQRKDELRLARAELRGGLPDKRQARKLASFVKTEGYDEYKHARLINSRGDTFKVFAGPAIKAIENVLYQEHEYVKHVPVDERAQLVASLRQAGLKYFVTDYTAFESHFTPAVMDALELQLYRHCLAGWRGVDTLCKVISGRNVMRTRSNVTGHCVAKRMSGEMSTSLANSFSNHMLALFIAHEEGATLRGFVEGDDGIWATDFDLKASKYAELGFTIKVEQVRDPSEASFCGLVFAESGQVVRDPRHFLANFSWTSSFIQAGDRIMHELLRAKALSCLHETPACPIVSALARKALEVTNGYEARFVSDGYHHYPVHLTTGPAAQVPSADTRDLFARRYGVSVEAQLLAEEAIAAGNYAAVTRYILPGADMEHYSSRYVGG